MTGSKSRPKWRRSKRSDYLIHEHSSARDRIQNEDHSVPAQGEVTDDQLVRRLTVLLGGLDTFLDGVYEVEHRKHGHRQVCREQGRVGRRCVDDKECRVPTLANPEQDDAIQPLALEQILVELFLQLLDVFQLRELGGELDAIEFDRALLLPWGSGAATAGKKEQLLTQRGQGYDGSDATTNDVWDGDQLLQKANKLLLAASCGRQGKNERGRPHHPRLVLVLKDAVRRVGIAGYVPKLEARLQPRLWTRW